MHNLFRRRNMHGGRECVIGGLATIAMIIGMHRLFAAHCAAQYFNGAVGNHFIGIHIGLRARTGLPNHKREMVVQLAFSHFTGSTDNRITNIFFQIIELHIGLGSRHFDNPQRAHQRQWHGFRADFEITQRALRLRAPIFFGRHVKRAKAIGFGARIGHFSISNGI